MPGVDKASGLRSVADDIGVGRHEVIGFGDMPNDIPMLEWAGRSFAVQGAPESVLAAASDVCGPNDADVVARALLPLLT